MIDGILRIQDCRGACGESVAEAEQANISLLRLGRAIEFLQCIPERRFGVFVAVGVILLRACK